jgi:hypothetical protein
MIDDRDLLKIGGGIVLAVAIGVLGWPKAEVYLQARQAEKQLQKIAKVPDSVRIDEYESKGGDICGRWSANNPFGQRISTRFVYLVSAEVLYVEPESRYGAEDELQRDVFLSRWKHCDGS